MRNSRQWQFCGFSLLVLTMVVPTLIAEESKGKKTDEEAVKEAVAAETKAFFRKDLDTLKSSWVHDGEVLRMDIGPGQASVTKGWPKIDEWYTQNVAGLPDFTNFQLRHENWTIRTTGNIAWVDFEEIQSGEVDGQPFETRGHGTRTLVKDSGQWKFVALTTEAGALFDNSAKSVETSLNGVGYKLLNAGKQDAAIKIFELNAQINPDSPNAFDSLAEAHMKSGNKAQAIVNYQKSLELNSGNTTAKDMLTKLKAE